MAYDFSPDDYPGGVPNIDFEHVPGGDLEALDSFENSDGIVVKAVEVGEGSAQVLTNTGLVTANSGDFIVFFPDTNEIQVFGSLDFEETFEAQKSAEQKAKK